MYSAVQRTQLQNQSYLRTQAVAAAVWIPEEPELFSRSLSFQLHRNFYTVNSMAELKNARFDFLLVVSEDASALSTTLGYFADAVAAGHDFVCCDCCFGPAGETKCYYPDSCRQSVRAAAVSYSLFRSLQLPVSTSAEQLIAAAQSAAAAPKHISQMLMWYHRPLQAQELFCRDTSRALLYAHELSISGAPLVLLSVVPELKKDGYSIAAAAPYEDKLLELYLQNDITVAVDADCVQGSSLTYLAQQADFVLANTACEYSVVKDLDRQGIPAVWWLHDAKRVYGWPEGTLPRQLHSVSAFCVSEYARRCFLENCPDCKAGILMYALEDAAALPSEDFPVPHHGKKLFTTIGSLENRKGSDILCRAIISLSAEIRQQCLFFFVGRPLEQESENMVTELIERFPQEVRYEEYIPRTHINSVLRQTDCILCPSRDDPLPTFVTEGWMSSVPCICSANTGSAALIQNGCDSFIYGRDDPDELAAKITEFLMMDADRIETMRKASRKIYEEHFTMDSFNHTFSEILKNIVSRRSAPTGDHDQV